MAASAERHLSLVHGRVPGRGSRFGNAPHTASHTAASAVVVRVVKAVIYTAAWPRDCGACSVVGCVFPLTAFGRGVGGPILVHSGSTLFLLTKEMAQSVLIVVWVVAVGLYCFLWCLPTSKPRALATSPFSPAQQAMQSGILAGCRAMVLIQSPARTSMLVERDSQGAADSRRNKRYEPARLMAWRVVVLICAVLDFAMCLDVMSFANTVLSHFAITLGASFVGGLIAGVIAALVRYATIPPKTGNQCQDTHRPGRVWKKDNFLWRQHSAATLRQARRGGRVAASAECDLPVVHGEFLVEDSTVPPGPPPVAVHKPSKAGWWPYAIAAAVIGLVAVAVGTLPWPGSGQPLLSTREGRDKAVTRQWLRENLPTGQWEEIRWVHMSDLRRGVKKALDLLDTKKVAPPGGGAGYSRAAVEWEERTRRKRPNGQGGSKKTACGRSETRE